MRLTTTLYFYNNLILNPTMISATPTKKIIAYLIPTFLISAGIQYYAITYKALNLTTVSLLMWTPGVVAIACSLLFGAKFQDLALFSRFKIKHLATGFFIPVIVAASILSLLLIFGIDQFQIHPWLVKKYETIPPILLSALVTMPLYGMILGTILALGEEIGWRGYLHTHLVESKVKHPYLITGLIWAVWHSPLVLFTSYASSNLPWLSAIMLGIVAIFFSYISGHLRTKSLSVWPVVLLHSSHNQWIQDVYPLFIKKGELDQYFGGESGVFAVATYALIALLYCRIQK